MIWVTAEDIVAIHSRIIQVSGGIDGLRDRAGLEAAIAAPLQSFGGEDLFPTDIEKIARIGFGLASNHAFIDGNKRIGAMVTQLLLKWNGYQFQLEQNELADMFIGIADGTKDETELRYWINDHRYTYPANTGPYFQQSKTGDRQQNMCPLCHASFFYHARQVLIVFLCQFLFRHDFNEYAAHIGDLCLPFPNMKPLP